MNRTDEIDERNNLNFSTTSDDRITRGVIGDQAKKEGYANISHFITHVIAEHIYGKKRMRWEYAVMILSSLGIVLLLLILLMIVIFP